MIPTIPSIPTIHSISSTPQTSNDNGLAAALNALSAPLIPNINNSSNFTTRPFNTNVSTTFANNNLPTLPIIAPLIPQSPAKQAEQQPQQPHMRIVRDGVLQQPMIPQYSEAITKTVDNANKRWNKEEESQMMSWAASGVSLSEIGNRLGRSSRAIKMRVILLLSTRFQNEGVFNGQPPADGNAEEICQRHHVTYNEVLEYNITNPNNIRKSRFPGNSNATSIPNPGTLPILSPLSMRVDASVVNLQPGQSTSQGSLLVNNNILTEIRDLLVQLNTKIDRLNNAPQ